MRKSKCPVCESSHTVKNGRRQGVQTYKCQDCGYQFRNDKIPSEEKLWMQYQEHKQTVAELAREYKTSESTIKIRLQNVTKTWEQPEIAGGNGFIHIDATYWGHNWGVLLAIEAVSGCPLYLEFIKNETIEDYKVAVSNIESRGDKIKGIIIDGKQILFKEFCNYTIQMCQFHMKQIVRRYITLNPRIKAARALNELVNKLTVMTKEDFENAYLKFKKEWVSTINKRSKHKNGKTPFTHKRLRSAIHSIDFYLPYLFSFQGKGCEEMPNTNNKIEGIFTDLKKNLNNHSGMSKENRKRFICGFFLALDEALSIRKRNSR